jgi:hypothetical protein
MKRFEFTVILSGEGETQEEAWNDAITQFCLLPETPLDDVEEVEREY